MAILYRLSYTKARLQHTTDVVEYFEAANDSAAVTEANVRLGREDPTTNDTLYVVGTEVSL